VTPYIMGHWLRPFLFRVSFWTFFTLLLLSLASGALGFAQTKVKPGFNLFSPDQDVEIGQQSAAEVERQMPLVNELLAKSFDRVIRCLRINHEVLY
jgi:hypothetical protein